MEQYEGSPPADDCPADEAPLPAPDEMNPYDSPAFTEDSADKSVGQTKRQTTPQSKPQPHILWALLLVLLLVAAQIGTLLVAAVVIVFVSGGRLTEGDLQAMSVQMVPVATFSTLAIAVLISLAMFRRRMFRKLGLRGCSALQWCLLAILLLPQAVLAGEIANGVMELLELLDNPVLDSLNDMSWISDFAQQPWPIVFLGACVFPGLGEEIFFRGVLSRGLVAWHGVVAGAIITSALFGIIHVAPAQACGTFVIGLVLQAVFMTTRSLWATILLHTANNAMAFAALHYGELVRIPGLTVETPGAVSHIPPVLVLAALALTAAVLGLLYQTRTRWITADGEPWSPGYFATEIPPADLGARAVNASPQPLLLAAVAFSVAAFFSVVWFVMN